MPSRPEKVWLKGRKNKDENFAISEIIRVLRIRKEIMIILNFSHWIYNSDFFPGSAIIILGTADLGKIYLQFHGHFVDMEIKGGDLLFWRHFCFYRPGKSKREGERKKSLFYNDISSSLASEISRN